MKTKKRFRINDNYKGIDLPSHNSVWETDSYAEFEKWCSANGHQIIPRLSRHLTGIEGIGGTSSLSFPQPDGGKIVITRIA